MKCSKKYSVILAFAIVVLLSLTFPRDNDLQIEELGIPTKEYYASNTIARCIWDMEIWDDKLFLGCGDYNNNSGPTPLLFCDIDSLGEWESAATLNEEQIGRLLIVNKKLTIPGLDSVNSPYSSTYYQMENGTLRHFPVIPNSFHVFDLVEFEGKVFLGIGGGKGMSSVVYTQDKENYIRVPIYKDGNDVFEDEELYVRTHNLYVLNNKLFAEFWCENMQNNYLVSEVYKYTGQKFEYHSTLTEKLHTSVNCKNVAPIFSKAIHNNTVFITTGFLYFSKDMKNFTMISFPDDAYTYDIYKYENKLYFLTATATDGGYKISVYSTVSESINDFEKEITFRYSMHPTAFVIKDNNYYIAFGEWQNSGSDTNGTILSIKENRYG